MPLPTPIWRYSPATGEPAEPYRRKSAGVDTAPATVVVVVEVMVVVPRRDTVVVVVVVVVLLARGGGHGHQSALVFMDLFFLLDGGEDPDAAGPLHVTLAEIVNVSVVVVVFLLCVTVSVFVTVET